jgi:hypothetical protein
MGKLMWVEMFWDIDASVDNGEPFDDVEEYHFISLHDDFKPT